MKRKMSMLLGMIILGQGMVLQAMNARVKQPATLESLAARKYAKSMLDTLTDQELSKLTTDKINEMVTALVAQGTISAVLAPLIAAEMPSVIFADARLSLGKRLETVSAMYASLPADEFARKLTLLLGNDPDWSNKAQELITFFKAENNDEVLRQLILRLMLSPNSQWTTKQKIHFIHAVNTYPKGRAGVILGNKGRLLYDLLYVNEKVSKDEPWSILNPDDFHRFILHAEEDFYSPLTLAIAVELGADINTLDIYTWNGQGETVLMQVVSNINLVPRPKTLQALLELGAKIEVGGHNALFDAVGVSNVGAVEILLKYGVGQITRKMISQALTMSQDIVDSNPSDRPILSNQAKIRQLLEASLQTVKD